LEIHAPEKPILTIKEAADRTLAGTWTQGDFPRPLVPTRQKRTSK
jgi:hypothetical protein